MVGKEQITVTTDGLIVRAPAKINLSLLIAGRRPDGFHEIETIIAKVNLYDEIFIQKGQRPGIELQCTGPYWAPDGEENLIFKACKLVLDSYRLKTDIKITLTKNIPAGSGLGSPSSDAAATLIGINRFLELALSQAQLSEMAAELGSDTAFFINGPLAICTGKGEKIKKLDEIFNFLALLMLPNVTVSTKKVYENYEHKQALYDRLSNQITGLVEKNRIDLVPKLCANMLQISCLRLHKELADFKAKIESLGIGPVCLSGSGSAMFCIVDNRQTNELREYQHKVAEIIGCKSIIVSNNRW